MSVNREMKSRRVKRWWFAAVVAAVAMFVPSFATAAFAEAEVGDTVWVGAKQGYGGTGIFPIYLQTPVDTANPGEPDFWAYCLENRIHAKTHIPAEIGDPSDFLGNNYFTRPETQGKVLWVLAHGYPALTLEEFGAAAGAEGISRNDAIQAVQYAIWRYTEYDTFDVDNWNWGGSDNAALSEAAYWHLVNGANASLGMTPGDFATTVSITPPNGAQQANSLVGPFTVNTNQSKATVATSPAFDITDEQGNLVDPNAVSDGQKLYLDLQDSSDPGIATLTASVQGSSASGRILSVPDPNAESGHWQTMALIAAAGKTTSAQASVRWAGTEDPAIGTTLTDLADGDHTVTWNGGTVVDTVAYQNLTPGVEYRLEGELMRKSDGSATGIVGSTVFTPSTPSGTVDVTFTVPTGYAGEYLVAFEELFETALEGEDVVAVHQDINDAAQTVLVEKAPVTTTPTNPQAPGKLANTGAELNGFAAAGAALLLLSGAVLVLARRRSQSES